MELIIIRHGRPERIENADGQVADPELTQVGHDQAAAMAAWMKAEHLDAIYASPMARARQTSAPLETAFDMEATVVPGVREFDDGESAYIPMEELKADKEAWKAMLEETANMPRDAFRAEVLESLNEITASNRGKKVAVVCHGGVINTYAADVLGLDGSMFFNPHYASINRFMVASSGERSVVSLNDCGHLRANSETLMLH